MLPTCTACQRPMPEGARLCVYCGYDRVSRTRVVVRGEPPPPEPPPVKVSPWTGPTAVALGILLAFGVAAPLVWRHQAATIVDAALAFALFVPLWFVQWARASRQVQDADPAEDDPGLRVAISIVEVLSEGRGHERGDRDGRSSAVTREMFSRRTAGRVQSALLASMLALIAAFYLLVGAFW